jgi:hypothetical protein
MFGKEARSQNRTIALAFGTGSGRSRTELTIAKMATLTAMQAEIVTTTAAAKPLLLRRDLPAYLTSRINISMISLITRHISSRVYTAFGLPKMKPKCHGHLGRYLGPAVNDPHFSVGNCSTSVRKWTMISRLSQLAKNGLDYKLFPNLTGVFQFRIFANFRGLLANGQREQ